VNTRNVPAELRHLIPLAKHFGVTDDTERERLVKASSSAEIAQLKQAVITHDDLLDTWLSGPECKGPIYSDEYIMFSAMRMAADYAA
jgi:hypothetical protein